MRHDSDEIGLKNVEEAVEKTLLYYKLYNSGVDKNTLHSFLLGLKVTTEELDDAVNSLLERKIISVSGNIIYLNKKIDSFYSRKNKKIDKKLTAKLLSFLNRVPFISSIAFSGGTANYGLENHEDIDLFIIAKPYSVYLVYFIIHIASLISKSRNILCPNYLIDETAALVTIQRDLFTAHQIIALKPFKNEKYLSYFLSLNSWVQNHYPNYNIPSVHHSKSSVLYSLLRPVNYIVFLFYKFLYRNYASQIKSGSILLGENIIKLHTHDYRSKVINEFKKQWSIYSHEKNSMLLTQSVYESGK